MKYFRLLIASLVMVVLSIGLFTGCGAIINGSGDLETLTYDYDGFTKVLAQDGFKVEVIQSNSYSVEVTLDDNILKYLEVEESDDTLKIRLTGNRLYNSVTIEARIQMPEINGIHLTGGSRGGISGFSSTPGFSVKLSGGSRLEGTIHSAITEFDLSGGSRVELAGSGKNMTIFSSGGSTLLLESFPVNSANIDISGGGSADVNISGTLDANLSGGSKVRYIGEPKLGDLNISGGSTISRK